MAPEPSSMVAGRTMDLASWDRRYSIDDHSFFSTTPDAGLDRDPWPVTRDGMRRGSPTGLSRDVRGRSVPAVAPDIGAFQIAAGPRPVPAHLPLLPVAVGLLAAVLAAARLLHRRRRGGLR
jgi:hypothetical protein